MKDSPFLLAPLGAEHDRDWFCCGEEALDRYFKTQATQDIRRRIANCFVAVEAAGLVAGYYTIAATGIPLVELPADQAKRWPRYAVVAAVRIGRLAVSEKFQGRGLGGALLADATRRTLQSPPDVYALVVDAKNDHAAAFYEHYLFRPMIGRTHALFLPLATAQKVFLDNAGP